MILDVYRDACDIDHLETLSHHRHPVAPRPNTGKGVQAGRVGGHASGGVAIDVYKLYLGTRYVESGRIYNLSRNCRSLGLCPGKVGDEGEEQRQEAELSHNPTVETEHRFAFLYKRMRAD